MLDSLIIMLDSLIIMFDSNFNRLIKLINFTQMISSLYSHNSTNVNYKKSLPKKQSSLGNQSNRKVGTKQGLVANNNSKQKMSAVKNNFIHEINYKNAVTDSNAAKSNQYLFNGSKSIKSRSCQNSTEKTYKIKDMKTLYVGSSTMRNNSSNMIKRNKRQTERIGYQLGRQMINSRQKHKNFFYEGNNTQKISQFKYKSKQLTPVVTGRKMTTLNQQLSSQSAKWNQTLVPYKYKQVLQKYSHYLTKFQKIEISEYKNVYYLGHKISLKDKQKHTKIQTGRKNNAPDDPSMFDNQDNEYLYELQDHIAYRYEVVQKMGKGSYGQVIKVYDHKKKQFVALKIVKNKTKFNQQAFIEIQILTHIKEKDTDHSSNIVKIKDFIIFRKHVCIVFELLSQNLYELIIRNNYNGLNAQLIRRFAIQILTSLQFLREESIVHCDLKPQNILLREYNKSGLKIIDMGSSCFKNQTKYTYIQSRYYRAPQITLGMKYSFQIDMWSAGCILGQLFTGIPLFPGENQKEQMKYFVKTLGYPLLEDIQKGERTGLFFNENGDPFQNVMNAKSIEHFQKPLDQRLHDPDFCDFILGFLKWNPKERFTPIQAINHKWIKLGLPPQISKILPHQKSEQIKKQSRSNSRKGIPRGNEHVQKVHQRQVQIRKSQQRQSLQRSNSIRIKSSSQKVTRKSKQLKKIKD